MRWFRLYNEFAHDPKVQSMPEEMQRRLIMLYCLQCEGCLPNLSDEEVTIALRIDRNALSQTKELFLQKNFITENWKIRSWAKRQMQSDSAAERMKRHRDKMKRNGYVTVTPPDTDTDTDTDTEEDKNKRTNTPKNTKDIPPKLEDVRAYIQEKRYGVDAERFMAFYDSKGWMIGKNKMKSWRAALLTWHKKDDERQYRGSGSLNVGRNDAVASEPTLAEKIQYKRALIENFEANYKLNPERWGAPLEKLKAELRELEDENK